VEHLCRTNVFLFVCYVSFLFWFNSIWSDYGSIANDNVRDTDRLWSNIWLDNGCLLTNEKKVLQICWQSGLTYGYPALWSFGNAGRSKYGGCTPPPPPFFLTGFTLISKMTLGLKKIAEIRESAENYHAWMMHACLAVAFDSCVLLRCSLFVFALSCSRISLLGQQ